MVVDKIMDRFTKYALVTMVLIVAIMTASAYIGYIVGGNKATDDSVNNLAGGGTTYLPFNFAKLGYTGQYIGFFIAGAIGGFIVGYIVPSVLNSSLDSQKVVAGRKTDV
jgi:hypothetical protein